MTCIVSPVRKQPVDVTWPQSSRSSVPQKQRSFVTNAAAASAVFGALDAGLKVAMALQLAEPNPLALATTPVRSPQIALPFRQISRHWSTPASCGHVEQLQVRLSNLFNQPNHRHPSPAVARANTSPVAHRLQYRHGPGSPPIGPSVELPTGHERVRPRGWVNDNGQTFVSLPAATQESGGIPVSFVSLFNMNE
ncbi:hypothetical protein Dda_3262 [Drechslerella dactyloides]|uniref:Uncharacterized protein n=1 Tax=Drechslerella dactyloides TaxID=74499 RepID=A0AAD6J104_DREDA|nr:hypothetical protein Dda_3262 [Drechslerella dactyloides]